MTHSEWLNKSYKYWWFQSLFQSFWKIKVMSYSWFGWWTFDKAQDNWHLFIHLLKNSYSLRLCMLQMESRVISDCVRAANRPSQCLNWLISWRWATLMWNHQSSFPMNFQTGPPIDCGQCQDGGYLLRSCQTSSTNFLSQIWNSHAP